jgi:hypothetical protein
MRCCAPCHKWNRVAGILSQHVKRRFLGLVLIAFAILLIAEASKFVSRSYWVPLRSHLVQGEQRREYVCELQHPGPYGLYMKVPYDPSFRLGQATNAEPKSVSGNLAFAVRYPSGVTNGVTSSFDSAFYESGRQAYCAIRFSSAKPGPCVLTLQLQDFQGAVRGQTVEFTLERSSADREGLAIWGLLGQVLGTGILVAGFYLALVKKSNR